MPAPPRLNTLDQGVDGNNVATSDPGSPDSFDAIDPTPPTYTNVQFHSSPLSMRWVTLTTVQRCLFTGLGSILTDVYARAYIFLPSLPSDNNFYPIAFRTSADATCSIIRVLAAGTIQARTAANNDAVASGSVAMSTNQWVRLEARMNVYVGQLEWWLFNNADSAVVTETKKTPIGAGNVFGANVDRVAFGTNTAAVAAGITVYFDDLAVNTTGFGTGLAWTQA